jgi:Rps23 Pro-64 3,4-dihydroxylase Tpa1-like proline 4-hydroxylase
MPMAREKRFYDQRNGSTRIDLFEELSDQALAAIRSFGRRLGAPHIVEEIILPILREGNSQLLAAVRDRPWPPWGLGARHISALCQTQQIADESYAVSPVYVTDDDLINVGLISAVYKEALDQLTVSPHAEVCYLIAEGSVLADQVLRANGFRKSDDVFVTWASRYYTYHIPARELLSVLGLDKPSTADLLAHDFGEVLIEKNALFHQTIYLASRAQWASDLTISEIIGLVRGGHASKPGGVPAGTGQWAADPEETIEVQFNNLLGAQRQELLDYLIAHESDFRQATVIERGSQGTTVNTAQRRASTLDDLGKFQGLLTDRIKEHLQPALQKLGHKEFPLGRIEMQATASNDGDYFRLHPDSDGHDRREITFVYFLHNEPRHYSGGELRIFSTRVIDGELVHADRSHLLTPQQDALVFFPSLNEHEVLPVRVPSKAFGDSRFTINGWIHRA